MRLAMLLFSLALTVAQAYAQTEIAIGDSVVYNNQRYLVVAGLGEPVFADDANFEKRVSASYIRFEANGDVFWLNDQWDQPVRIDPSDPRILLHKTAQQIKDAPQTTGLVLYRDEDAAPTVNVPVDDVIKIEPEE